MGGGVQYWNLSERGILFGKLILFLEQHYSMIPLIFEKYRNPDCSCRAAHTQLTTV